MYSLLVFNSQHREEPLRIELRQPAQVLDRFRQLVREFPDCERIELHGAEGLLFSTKPASLRPPRRHADMILDDGS